MLAGGCERAFALLSETMSLKRMDHVSVVVEDLPSAVSFFTTLGMEVEGRSPVEGAWVDRLCGLEGVRVEIAMMRMPEGQGRVELTKFHHPGLVEGGLADPPPNTQGLRQIMFEVTDLEATAGRLMEGGATRIGEVVRYGDMYKLCYLRGPAGIIVALAEELS